MITDWQAVIEASGNRSLDGYEAAFHEAVKEGEILILAYQGRLHDGTFPGSGTQTSTSR